MADSKFESELLIKAGVKGLETIAKLGAEIESAGVDVSKLNQHGAELSNTFSDIENKQSLLTNFRELKQAAAETSAEWQTTQDKTKALAQSWKAAKAEADKLKAALESQGEITKKQQAAYDKAVAKSEKLGASHQASVVAARKLKKQNNQLNISLHETRTAMREAGLSTQGLAQQEKALQQQSKEAEQSLSDLSDEARRLQDIAKAKVTLGIDADERARKEILAAKRAYEKLKDSGLLSSKELARANELHTQKVKQLESQLSRTAPKLQKVSAAVGGVNRAFGGLQGLLATLGVSVGVSELVSMADAFKDLEARVRLATGEGANFVTGFQGVQEIANETFTSIEDTGELFARLSRAGEEMQMAQQDVLSVTKTVNQAIKLSGGSAEANQAAITQLIQGLQSGVLRGEEFNSVLEQSPRLARAMADGLGVTIGELRKLANEGKLTSETVIKSIQSQSDTIQSEFNSLPDKVSNSLAQLKNNFMSFLGEIDREFNSSDSAASFIQSIANGIDDIDPATLDAVKEAFSQLGEIAQLLGETVINLADDIADVWNAFDGSTAAGQEVGLLTKIMQELSIWIGHIADGMKAMQIAGDTVFGALIIGAGGLVAAYEKLTGKTAEASDALFRKGDELLSRAKQNALEFESSAVKAAENAAKTTEQRLDEAAQKARESYEQMAKSGTTSAGKVQEAFIKYTKAAIKANNNVVDERLKAELAEQGLQAAVTETGKVAITQAQKIAQATNDVKFGGILKKELDEASDAFKAIGLDASEFATGISTTVNTALDSYVQVSQLAGDNTEQLARAYAATKEKLGESTQAQALLEQKLKQVTQGNAELASAVKATAAAQQAAKSASDDQSAALDALGISMDAVNNKMSTAGADMVKTLKTGVTAIKAQATNAEALGTALTQALDVAIPAAKTKADFQEIQKVLQEAGVSSRVTAEQMKLISTGANGGAAAINKASEATKKQTQAVEDNTRASQENASAKSEQAQAAQATAQAEAEAAQSLSQSTSTLDGMTSSIVAYAHQQVHGLQKIGLTADQTQAIMSTLFDTIAGQRFPSYEQYAQAIQSLTDNALNQAKTFARLKNEAVSMTQQLGSATVTSNDLSRAQGLLQRATTATVNGMIRMDAQTLDNLKRSIDGARQRMKGLASDAKNTADSLQASLARLKGDDVTAQRIDNTKKLAGLEQRLQEARRRGNTEEVAQLTRALSLQKKINDEESKQAKERQRQQRDQQRQRQEQEQARRIRSLVESTPEPTGNRVSASDVVDAFEKRIQTAEERAGQRMLNKLKEEARRRTQ